jgi:hypothetical protein
MVALDLSVLSTFIPVFGFLLVFVVTYALLGKTKLLGDHKFVHILVSFCVAILFLISTNAIKYVATITPWFAALVVSLLLIGLIVGLMGEKPLEAVFKPGFAWFIVIVLIVIFLASGAFVFSDIITRYIEQGQLLGESTATVIGVVVLLGITVFASWLLTKKQG